MRGCVYLVGAGCGRADLITLRGLRLLQCAQNMEQENNVENLIKAKGFADCVAFIQNGECSVVVASEGLLDSEAITIKDIVAGQTGISFDKIKIVEAK